MKKILALCLVLALPAWGQTVDIDLQLSAGPLTSDVITMTLDRPLTIQWVDRMADRGNINMVATNIIMVVDPPVATNDWDIIGSEVVSNGFVVAWTNATTIADPGMLVDTNATQTAQNQAILNHFAWLLMDSMGDAANLSEQEEELHAREALDAVEVRGRTMIQTWSLP